MLRTNTACRFHATVGMAGPPAAYTLRAADAPLTHALNISLFYYYIPFLSLESLMKIQKKKGGLKLLQCFAGHVISKTVHKLLLPAFTIEMLLPLALSVVMAAPDRSLVVYNPHNMTVTEVHMIQSAHFDAGCKYLSLSLSLRRPPQPPFLLRVLL